MAASASFVITIPTGEALVNCHLVNYLIDFFVQFMNKLLIFYFLLNFFLAEELGTSRCRANRAGNYCRDQGGLLMIFPASCSLKKIGKFRYLLK